MCSTLLSYIILQITVPAKDTTYLYTVMEVPQFFQNETHYIVKVGTCIYTYLTTITKLTNQYYYSMLQK